MYENIGGKIKGLAKGTAILGIIGSIIGGIAFITEELVLIGIFVLVFGSLGAWMSTWLIYGFGELIETAQETRDTTHRIGVKILQKISKTNYGKAVESNIEKEKALEKKQLDSLRKLGFIDDEDYLEELTKH